MKAIERMEESQKKRDFSSGNVSSPKAIKAFPETLGLQKLTEFCQITCFWWKFPNGTGGFWTAIQAITQGDGRQMIKKYSAQL